MISYSPGTVVDQHHDNQRRRVRIVIFFGSFRLEPSRLLPCRPPTEAPRGHSLSAYQKRVCCWAVLPNLFETEPREI
jgi:hypothetical protein